MNKKIKLPSKQVLKKTGITLSIVLNVAAAVLVLVIIYDVHSGHLNYLTDGTLQVDTCNNYFNDTKIKQSGFYQQGDVNFVKYYLTPAERLNKCNSLNNNINFQYLVQADNQKALDYYDNMTGFGSLGLDNIRSQYIVQGGLQYQVQIPYSTKTYSPVDPTSMGLSY
jgi:hypothetical protein